MSVVVVAPANHIDFNHSSILSIITPNILLEYLLNNNKQQQEQKGGYPARLKKVLIVTAPLWFKAPFKILRLFVREKLRERVFTVSIPTLSLHVPRQALPTHLGGTLDIDHSKWLLQCHKSMTNRDTELLANVDGLATTKTTNNHNILNIAATADLNNPQTTITSNDCRPAFLLEPNENLTTYTFNGHLTLLPVNTNSSSSNTLTLGRGVTTIDNNTVLTSPVLLNIDSTISKGSNCNTVGGGVSDGDCVGVGGVSVVPGSGNSSATTQSSQSDFWAENPPSSASSGFSDDDSLAGQEGDPKTIEHIVQMVKTLRHQGLVKEYLEIRSKATEGTFVNAKMRNNLAKNRYSDVLCYDHSRVVLSKIDGDEQSDYINANFVDGYKQKNAYISTQGPLPKTFHDFWRMIWEQHCLVIVMTTRVMERSRLKCGQYWQTKENSSLQFGNFEVYTHSVETSEDYTVTSIELRNQKTDETRMVSHWQFTSWPDYGVPSSAKAVIGFLQLVREKQSEMVKDLGDTWAGHARGPPIVVHCSAGIGRTGTFITLDICISRLEDVGTVDIRGTVEKIRSQRAYSIQMPDQYAFCHLALIEYAVARKMIHPVDLTGFYDREDESE